MTRTEHPTGPNTEPAKLYRRDVWCHHCHAPRWFRHDATNGTRVWVCEVCAYVETTADGELAPSPWVERPDSGAMT